MRFGHPLELVSDRGTHFLNDVIYDITTKYLINHRKTTPYNPKANGLTERANGIIRKVLNKMVAAHKIDWDLKLPSAVHAYNTSEKRATGRNPYFLVFGQVAIHGIEMEVETHRILAARTGNRIEDLNTRLIALEDLEEARTEALEQTEEIQTRRKKEFIQNFRKIMASGRGDWYYYMTTDTNNFWVSFIPDGWDHTKSQQYTRMDPSN